MHRQRNVLQNQGASVRDRQHFFVVSYMVTTNCNGEAGLLKK